MRKARGRGRLSRLQRVKNAEAGVGRVRDRSAAMSWESIQPSQDFVRWEVAYMSSVTVADVRAVH